MRTPIHLQCEKAKIENSQKNYNLLMRERLRELVSNVFQLRTPCIILYLFNYEETLEVNISIS